MESPIDIADWRLTICGEVEKEVELTFDEILRMPKATVANTLECSGNGRSLLAEKAKGNPWTIGGVGNAVWGGVWLKDVLQQAGLRESAKHVSFEGFDKPAGSAGIKFIRSIPIEKALSSTLLAYEMNGEPLPLKHGYPLRGLALGWTGANCIKWLSRITVLGKPFEGFYMDKVYRIFQKDQEPRTGEVVAGIPLKSIITQPLVSEKLPAGPVVVLGAAYGGEVHPSSVGKHTGKNGNQQKSVMARALQDQPHVLILHQPTVGVDAAAKREILEIVCDAVRQGAGVLYVSTEYEELAHLCHRVLVFENGRIQYEISGQDVTEKEILARCHLG
jgi:DMSO/TMAO reductase YedYZ molybdopterin-dependent catalytic subunit